ncbi:Hypothetical protein A7982_04931 [Minicystis rosea]|nr:Hypothetical protein A7982_04931 [Minicystis rosea]
MLQFRAVMDVVGMFVDSVGVLVILVGAIGAIVGRLRRPGRDPMEAYRTFRQSLGRSILLGLELLVAGDIIRTVVVAPTLQNVVILGLIVLIRTFLSVALQLEIEGRWPWQRGTESARG